MESLLPLSYSLGIGLPGKRRPIIEALLKILIKIGAILLKFLKVVLLKLWGGAMLTTF
jgi:hypothetical protein